MTRREILKTVRGHHTVDGAGVHLTRVLAHDDTRAFDPFLMLDSFDSTDSADYVAGFPTHPHRGIETITYLIEGRIEHEDSLGNRGAIIAGESQWMTAGSGILHQEMPIESPRMLGFQLWLNLSAEEKMCDPAYLSITREMIPVVERGAAKVHVISGKLDGKRGARPKHLPATILDIELPGGAPITLTGDPEETAFVFLIEGSGTVNGQLLEEKVAVLLGHGDEVSLAAPAGEDARMIYFSAPPLHEPIAWGGPIVMNTQQELAQAFADLRAGTFIRSV